MNNRPISNTEYDEKEFTRKVRELNDILRNSFITGRVFFTRGFVELDENLKSKFILAIHAYKDFTPDNDPYDEHDYGFITIDGIRVLWQIDYYDANMEDHSLDPSEPEQTTRVLTIMLPHEQEKPSIKAFI